MPEARRALATLALLLVASPAGASVFDTYGFGARAASMANAHAAIADDYTAVYYNPGALTVHKVPHVGTGIDVIVPGLSIDRQARDGAPDTTLPQENVGINIGLLFPLGGLIENRFALAIGAFMPTLQVTRATSVDPETPNFYRYEARPDKLIVAPALAYEIHERVSVGVGMQILGGLNGGAAVELDVLTQRFTRKELRVDVETDSAITAGVLLRPLGPKEPLRVGFSFRDQLSLEYTLITDILIKDAGRLVADIRGTSLYTPAQYTWAVGYDPRPGLTVTADVVWARWSAAPDPSSRFDVTLDGEPLGLGAIQLDSPRVDLGAVDTVSPRVGVEWRPWAAWAFRTGYALQPTPLPAQTGRTNYVDSDAHQIGFGAGYAFPDPLAMHAAPLTVDASAQLTVLASRAITKTDSQDRVGDYESGGSIWHFGLTLRHDFY